LGKPLQLFDLAKDLGEKKNLAAEHPEIVERLSDLMESSRTESKEWPLRR
jgi:hypothetical protein